MPQDVRTGAIRRHKTLKVARVLSDIECLLDFARRTGRPSLDSDHRSSPRYDSTHFNSTSKRFSLGSQSEGLLRVASAREQERKPRVVLGPHGQRNGNILMRLHQSNSLPLETECKLEPSFDCDEVGPEEGI